MGCISSMGAMTPAGPVALEGADVQTGNQKQVKDFPFYSGRLAPQEYT